MLAYSVTQYFSSIQPTCTVDVALFVLATGFYIKIKTQIPNTERIRQFNVRSAMY